MVYLLATSVSVFVPVIFARLAPNVSSRLKSFCNIHDQLYCAVFYFHTAAAVIGDGMATDILDHCRHATVENLLVCRLGFGRDAAMEFIRISNYQLTFKYCNAHYVIIMSLFFC